MAHRRRSGFAKKIETVHWTTSSFASAGLAAGTAAVTIGAAQHLPETLMRIRGEYVAGLDGVQPSNSGILVTQGIIQVPEGTGTTVLWSPFTDGDAPWIWWDSAGLQYEEYVTDVVGTQVTMSVRRTIDSKAMRKIRNTELQWVVENTTMQAAASTNVFGQVRVLSGS